MEKFFSGVLSSAVIFAVCLAVSVAVLIIKERTNNKGEIKGEEEEKKVYYVKSTVREKKRKNPRKKTDIALKGIVVSPKEIEKIKTNR